MLALFILTMASHFVGANAQSQYGILYNGRKVQNGEMSIAADPPQTPNTSTSPVALSLLATAQQPWGGYIERRGAETRKVVVR